MGLLPLQFKEGENADSLGLTGKERFSIDVLKASSGVKKDVVVEVYSTDGGSKMKEFVVTARLDTEPELEYFKSGGILTYVLRKLARSWSPSCGSFFRSLKVHPSCPGALFPLTLRKAAFTLSPVMGSRPSSGRACIS